LYIGGNISCTGTWDMWGKSSTDDINVIMNGTTQSISGTATYSWNNLTVNTGSTTTISTSSTQTIYGNLSVLGTLNLGTTTMNRNASGGTLTVSGTFILGGNSGGRTGSNFPNNFSTMTLTGGTIVYNYTGAQTVYSSPVYTNLTLSGSGIKTLTSATVNGILSMEGTAAATGTPNYASTATLQYKGTASISTSNNEFPAGFAGTGGIIIDQGIGNTVTLNANKTALAGNLNIKSGIFNLSSFTANRASAGGTLTIASGATLKIGGTNTLPSNYSTHAIDCASTIEYSGAAQTVANLNSSQSYGNLILSGSGIKTLQTGTTTICNNFTVTGTANTTGVVGLTIGGNLLIDVNALFAAGAFTHNVGGNWTKNGTFTATGSTINFNSSSASQNISASSFNNVTFTGAGIKTATGILTIAGNTIISSNFTAGNFSHTLSGNWTNNGTFTAGTSTITLSGNTAKTIGGSSTTNFNHLTINGTGGATLGVNATVSGTLTLTSGLLDINNYNLTSNTISGGSASSYIKTSGAGRLKRNIVAGGTIYTYPVGKSAYNPINVSNTATGSGNSDDYSIRVEDGGLTNTNIDSKTVDRKWYIQSASVGVPSLTIVATYNSGEASSSFNAASSPKIGYFSGSSWAYGTATAAGSGPYTLTSSATTLDMSSSTGFLALGSEDAFSASKFSITVLPPTPFRGLNSSIATIQSLNSSGIPTYLSQDTYFNLTSNKSFTRAGGLTGILFAANTYQTTLNNIQFLVSTWNSGTGSYDVTANVTATRTSGEVLTSGITPNFAIKDGNIYKPAAPGNWSTVQWKKSTDGGNSWTNTILPLNNIFAETDVIRIPADTTITADITASFYSMLVFGTLDINGSGTLTINHSSGDLADYNLKVYGTLKNSGGALTNSNPSFNAIEFYGGTYWHAMNGGSIPTATWNTLNSTLSTCNITGITSTALSSGLNQNFQNFTWNNEAQGTTQNLTSDLSVSGALNLTNGIITTGTNHVILNTGGSVSSTNNSHINGNLRIYVPNTTSPTVSFPIGDATNYAPVSVAFTGTISGSGYLDANTVAVQPPVASGLSQTKYINRLWSLNNTSVSGFSSYSPTFTFVDGDKVGTPTTSALIIRKLDNFVWANTTDGIRTANTTQCTDLTTFSDFAIGETDCTTTNYIWMGGTNTDWNTASNWCNNLVPTSTIDVTIPSGPTNQPIIGATGGTCKNITIESGASLTIASSNSLNVTGNWLNNGSFTSNTSTVSFTGTSAQTITGTTTFNALTINNSAGVTAANDLTVNGTLNLQSANPSAIAGALDMGANTLNMGANATNIGIGDVTGVVKRQQTFVGNTIYTFGNPSTNVTFLDVVGAVKPTSISCKIAIGVAPLWRDTAINRYYSFAQEGSGTDRTIVRLHYLDSELHDTQTDPNKLVFWDAYTGPTFTNKFPRGKTSNDATNKWIGLTGMAINFIAPNSTLDYKQWGLGYTNVTKKIWTGNGSITYTGDWSLPGNWDGGVPTSTDDVVIPATLPGDTHGYPTRNLNPTTVPAVANTIEIEASASLTVDNYDITVSGSTGAWLNSGTFTPGTGKVIFNHNNTSEIVNIGGSTNFYNLEIGPSTLVRPNTNSYIGISGNLTADPTAILHFNSNYNTLEYKGVNHSIINPVGLNSTFGYSNLKFSNSGTATLPAQLNVLGNLILNGAINTTTNNNTLILNGNATQTISGSISSILNNLTINNVAGVTDSTDITVNGVLNLISDNPASNDRGALDIANNQVLHLGANSTTTGSADVSGIINRSHSFITETFYNFGNPNNGIIFGAASGYPGQTLPSSLSLKVKIGTAPDWTGYTGPAMTNPINRSWEISQTGGSGNRALMRVHYRDNEIPNGVSEDQLTIWTASNVSGTYYTKESGRSNYNTSLDYVAIQNVDMAIIPSVWSNFKAALAPSSATNYTWVGTISTDWNDPSNWTPNGVPDATHGAIIPNTYTTTYAPTLPASASCISLQLNTGSVLNAAASGGTLTLTGANAAWSAQAGAVYNANTSTVIFNANAVSLGETSIVGSTNFYNVTIENGTLLRPGSLSYIGIAGELINNGTLDAATNENDIEFNSNSNQDIPNPNGTTAGYHNLILSGSGTKNLPVTLNIVDEFTNNTASSGTVNAGSGTVVFDGNSIYGQTINGTTVTNFDNLTINNPTDTVNVTTPINVNSQLTITTGSTMNMFTNDLGGTSYSLTTSGSGTLYTQSTSITPLTSNITWTFPVIYNASSAQTVAEGTYNNITINNSAGATIGGDITVNGILNLQSVNPSSTQGTLSTSSYTLNMGANSTTTGVGDVTGVVKRSHAFVTSQQYSFGNKYTDLAFMGISTKPSWVSCTISIGTAPTWKSGAVMRTYNFTQNGGTDKVSTNLHYLDSELNGNNESKIVLWDEHSGGAPIHEHGKSNNDITNNWVSLSGLSISYLSATDKQWALSNSAITKNTWLGADVTEPTRWDLAANWSAGHFPGDTGNLADTVLIPSGVAHYPILTSAVEMSTLEIESGASLIAGSNNITISGYTGAWMNNGSFSSSAGSVIFSHGNLSHIVSIAGTNNNFYNLVVNANTALEPSTGSYMKIAGAITIDPSSVMSFTTNQNTVEFNGGDQTLINLSNNGGYHDLVISGTGTKTFPSQLNIAGDFTNNGTVATGTGTVIMKDQGHVQNIGGTTSTTFYNLTIDNANQVVTASTNFDVSNTFKVNGNTTMDMKTADLGGTFTTTTGTGTLKTQSTSATSLPSGKTWTFGVIYNNTTAAQTVPAGTYSSLQISNPTLVTASGALNCTAITVDNGSTLDMSTFALSGGSSVNSFGTIKTQNISSTPIPVGKTWDGVVLFNGTGAQSLVGGYFNNLAIDNAVKVRVTDITTVNGTLLINSGKLLIINPGAKMTANLITNNAGVSGLIIESSTSAANGTLIFNNPPTSPVMATVGMYCKASWDLTNQTPGGKYKWQFFGIPVATLDASPTFDGDYVRLHNEAGNGTGYTSDKRWIQLTTYSTLSPFSGYEITQPAERPYLFQGQLVNSNFSSTLAYTASSNYPGQHILSNPYTAAIDITQMSFGDGFDKTVYLYNTGSQSDWTSQGGTIGNNPGQYIAAPQKSIGLEGIPSQIPSMQAFLVMAKDTLASTRTLGITYNSAATRNIDQQRAPGFNDLTAEKVYTIIDIAGRRYSDKMWLLTEPSCSHGYDNGWDGTKFLGTSLAPQLWAKESSGDYQIDAVNNINNTELGFIKGEDSTYTMTFTHYNTTSVYSSISLMDYATNSITDITKSGSTYTFAVVPAFTQPNRFKIISGTTALNDIKNTIDTYKVYNSHSTIFVENSSNQKGELAVYDAAGKIISNYHINTDGLTTIPTNLIPGTYLLKINTSKDIYSKSIIIP
jgi:hypothetical protein